MRKAFGTILILLGFVSMLQTNMAASRAPDLSYLFGELMAGVLFLVFGGLLCRPKRTPATNIATTPEELANRRTERHVARLGDDAAAGILGAVAVMFTGSSLAQHSPDLLLVGTAVSFGGWALFIWGCVNFMRLKGYSGWYGLFGYTLLLGLIILACFPDRRKRLLASQQDEGQIFEIETALPEDRIAANRYLLALVPLGLFALTAGLVLYSIGSNTSPADWQDLTQPSLGLHALMPGTPQIEHSAQDTPAGRIEKHKFTARPKGKRELFMIVAIRFPEEVGSNLGGLDKILELGRKDVVAAAEGVVQSEKPIVLNGCSGVELEILPTKGAVVKAQVFVRQDSIYEVAVSIPKMRLASEDVQKFFGSIELSEAADHSPETTEK